MLALLSILTARADCSLVDGAAYPGDPIVMVSDGPIDVDLWRADGGPGRDVPYRLSSYVAGSVQVTILTANLEAGGLYVAECDGSGTEILTDGWPGEPVSGPTSAGCSHVGSAKSLVGIVVGLLASVRRRSSWVS